MLKLFENLGREAGSDEISDKLEEATTALRGAKTDHRALVEKRPVLLLDGTDAEVVKLEAAVAAKAREIERLELAIAALEDRAADAREREAAQALDRRLQEDRRDATRLGELLDAYERDAAALAALLGEISAIRARVRAGNDMRREAGRDERVADPQRERTKTNTVLSYAEIETGVVLPKVEGAHQRHWPPGGVRMI